MPTNFEPPLGTLEEEWERFTSAALAYGAEWLAEEARASQEYSHDLFILCVRRLQAAVESAGCSPSSKERAFAIHLRKAMRPALRVVK